MKLIKFTSILLCLFLLVSVFAGCNAPDGNKTDISKNDTGENASVIPEEVSRQESEVTEKIEPWGTDYDWDFLKGWPRHNNNIADGYGDTWEPYQNYSNTFYNTIESHEGVDVLVHVALQAYYPDPNNIPYRSDNEKDPCDIEEIQSWLKAGGIPFEYQTFEIKDINGNKKEVSGFLGYISFEDLEKLIEYGNEYGYHLYFSHVTESWCVEDDNSFDCPKC